MAQQELEQTARQLIAEGKGILAADETVSTITKRFDALKLPPARTAVAPIAKCCLRRRELRFYQWRHHV